MTWLTRMHLRTWQHQMTTIMQPFQCDLQLQIQETHRTTHTGTTTGCRTQRRNRLNSKRSKPHPPHTRGTFHRRLKPLYTEKYKVSCSGFLPKRKPMQHSCSHYNAFFQCDLQPQIQETHRTTHTGTTTRCRTQMRNRLNSKRSKPTRRTDEVPFIAGWSHFTRKNTRFRAPASSPKESPCNIHAAITMRFSNAICNHRFKKRIELRTQEQPLVAEHRVGTDWTRNDPNRTRRTNEVPVIAGWSHFTRKKYKVSCSGFLPKRKPMQHSCSHYNAFFQCDLQPQIQETHRTTHTGTTTRCRTQRRNRLNSKRSKPTRRTDEVPFIAGWSHFTRKNARFRAPASSPKHSPFIPLGISSRKWWPWAAPFPRELNFMDCPSLTKCIL